MYFERLVLGVAGGRIKFGRDNSVCVQHNLAEAKEK